MNEWRIHFPTSNTSASDWLHEDEEHNLQISIIIIIDNFHSKYISKRFHILVTLNVYPYGNIHVRLCYCLHTSTQNKTDSLANILGNLFYFMKVKLVRNHLFQQLTLQMHVLFPLGEDARG